MREQSVLRLQTLQRSHIEVGQQCERDEDSEKCTTPETVLLVAETPHFSSKMRLKTLTFCLPSAQNTARPTPTACQRIQKCRKSEQFLLQA